MHSVGAPLAGDAASQIELSGVAFGVDHVDGRMPGAAIMGRVQVATSRENHPIQRNQKLIQVWLARGDEQGDAPRPTHCLDIDSRQSEFVIVVATIGGNANQWWRHKRRHGSGV